MLAARVVKLVYTRDLKSLGGQSRHAGSSPAPGTNGDHMKRLLCCVLIALTAGCIPIGIRGSSQLASTATPDACSSL